MRSLLLTGILFISTTAFAAGEFGVGAMIGNPTGLNGKYWLSEKHAVDAGLGMSFGKKSNFSMHSDYLFHSDGALVFQDEHPLDLYYGVGGRMEFSDDIELGLRIPVGVAHRMENNTADVYGEIAPILDFVGRTGLEVHLLFGVRYYF